MNLRQNGFTLYELMFVLALSGIALSMAVPSFDAALKNNAIAIQTNNLIADINLARSEAIKRGVSVFICRSGNLNTATPTCGGNNNTWSEGWLVFASGDANSDYDAGTDSLLRVTDLNPENGVTVISNASADSSLEYLADGTTNQGNNTALLAVCDERGTAQGKQVQISPTGRPRLVYPVPVSCSNPA